jgi:protein-S-isoprenylcysteine O-methyltransferase Ste14
MINLAAVTIFCELSAAAAVLFSIRHPVRRIWPPDNPRTWKTVLMGFLFFASATGVGLLGLLDWGTPGWPDWIRIGFGLPMLIGGMGIFFWAQAFLGFRRMMGAESALAVGGPFRFSRNPQYVGCLLMLAGWGAATGSLPAVIASIFACIPLILVPFAEEPWLRERYGSAYDNYFKKVRRFL